MGSSLRRNAFEESIKRNQNEREAQHAGSELSDATEELTMPASIPEQNYNSKPLVETTATTTNGAGTAASSSPPLSSAQEEEREDYVYVLQGKGCPRRCGGLGDILSGTTAVALHWAMQVAKTIFYCIRQHELNYLFYVFFFVS